MLGPRWKERVKSADFWRVFMNSQRALIVGGGIGGLTLANALQQRGIDFDVVEKADEFLPVGAGISLALNAMTVFKNLGLAKAITRRSTSLPQASICDQSTNELRTLDFGELTGQVSADIKAIRRSDLQSILLETINPKRFRMGEEVDQIVERGSEVRVTFSNSDEANYNVVIGADGVHSKTRSLVFGGTSRPTRVGVDVWLFTLKSFPHENRFRESVGDGRRVGIVPLTNGDAFIFLTRNSRHPVDWGSDHLAVQKDFAQFGGLCSEALSRLDEVDHLVRREFLEVRLPKWTRGRIALMGDAAHAMTPNMGQGAAMAIEDAHVIANLMDTDDDWKETMTRYERSRRRRVDWMQNQSARVGWIMQAQSNAFQTLRSYFIRWSPIWMHARAFRIAHMGGPSA